MSGTTIAHRGLSIVTTTSAVTRRTRHAVWSANGVHLKSFDQLESAFAYINRFVDQQEKRK